MTAGHKTIGYHTRLVSDNAKKVVGGSFHGPFGMEAVNALVNSQFTVVVKSSGTPVFVDPAGREVRLYVSVDAEETDKGGATLKQWRLDKAARDAEETARAEREQAEIEDLLCGLSHEEAVRRLRAASRLGDDIEIPKEWV